MKRFIWLCSLFAKVGKKEKKETDKDNITKK